MFPRALRLSLFLLLGSLLLSAPFAATPTAPIAAAASGRIATAEELQKFTESLEKTAGDLRRWAYTESQLFKDEKGKVKTDVLVRHDPSLPYAQQYVPLLVNGKPPTAKDFEKYRKQGERGQKRIENPSSDRRKSLGEVLDLRTVSVVSETPQAMVFEVPLKKEGNDRFPPEKFQVLMRVNRDTFALENIAVRLRGSFRAKLVVKVKSGEGTLDFAVINPKYPPTLTSLSGDASASVFFVSVGGEFVLKRTELKHVKPFDERFEVQIGNLKAIDF